MQSGEIRGLAPVIQARGIPDTNGQSPNIPWGHEEHSDTIGDLAMDLLGAAAAAGMVLVLPACSPQPSPASRLRPMAAFTSAPRTSARLVSQSQVSVMMTPASDPQALL